MALSSINYKSPVSHPDSAAAQPNQLQRPAPMKKLDSDDLNWVVGGVGNSNRTDWQFRGY